jgi:hypothetical protein
LLAVTAADGAEPAREVPLVERVGITHVAGKYHFTDGDYLNEGADQILRLGSRVIKLYLDDPARSYPFNSEWGQFRDMVELVQHRYYQALFRKPFKTYVMTATGNVARAGYYRSGVSEEQYAAEVRQFHALATYLLTTYKDTGKTFILSHWEGDWAVRGNTKTDHASDPTAEQLAGMAQWLNARQEGVTRARQEVRGTTARVFHAAEVNLVRLAMEGRPTVTNHVVPKTRCDLYSYSAYDTANVSAGDPAKGRDLFRRALEYLAAKAPDSEAFGAKNVYVGEFGYPEVRSEKDPNTSSERQMQVIRTVVDVGLDFGCPYLLYWQIYDNECRKSMPAIEECRGFWLIRPDGTRSAGWEYFAALLARGSTTSGPAGNE